MLHQAAASPPRTQPHPHAVFHPSAGCPSLQLSCPTSRTHSRCRRRGNAKLSRTQEHQGEVLLLRDGQTLPRRDDSTGGGGVLDTGQTGQAFVCLRSSTVSESFFFFLHAILAICPIFTFSQIKAVGFIHFAFNMVLFFSTITLFCSFQALSYL